MTTIRALRLLLWISLPLIFSLVFAGIAILCGTLIFFFVEFKARTGDMSAVHWVLLAGFALALAYWIMSCLRVAYQLCYNFVFICRYPFNSDDAIFDGVLD